MKEPERSCQKYTHNTGTCSSMELLAGRAPTLTAYSAFPFHREESLKRCAGTEILPKTNFKSHTGPQPMLIRAVPGAAELLRS